MVDFGHLIAARIAFFTAHFQFLDNVFLYLKLHKPLFKALD